MIYELCEGTSQHLVDLWSCKDGTHWNTAKAHFAKKGYIGKFLLIARPTPTSFRLWNINIGPYSPRTHLDLIVSKTRFGWHLRSIDTAGNQQECHYIGCSFSAAIRSFRRSYLAPYTRVNVIKIDQTTILPEL